jgi:hypothetical protein
MTRRMKDDTADFAEEYTVRERVRLAARGIALGGLAILAWKLWLLPEFEAFVGSAPCRALFGANGTTVLWYGLFAGLPLLVLALLGLTHGRRGVRILRDGQFPPIGEKVLRRTRIRRGSAARRIGCIHLFTLVPAIAFVIWGGFQAHRFARGFQPMDPACARMAPAHEPSSEATAPARSGGEARRG